MWKNRRKFGHAALSMINDDSGNTERKIEKESEELHLRIHAKQGRSINMKKELGKKKVSIDAEKCEEMFCDCSSQSILLKRSDFRACQSLTKILYPLSSTFHIRVYHTLSNAFCE